MGYGEIARNILKYSGVFIVAIFIIFFKIYDDPYNYTKRTKINLSYSGNIVSIYADSTSKDEEVFVLDNGEKHAIGSTTILDSINVGDSVYKSAGTLRHSLIKKNTKRIIYYYPTVLGIELKMNNKNIF